MSFFRDLNERKIVVAFFSPFKKRRQNLRAFEVQLATDGIPPSLHLLEGDDAFLSLLTPQPNPAISPSFFSFS